MKQVDMLSTVVLLLFMTIAIALPVSAGPGTTAAPILKLGGGTRAAALGDAFSAINNDVTAALWNPSGLGIMERKQAAISYVDRAQLSERQERDCTMLSSPVLCHSARQEHSVLCFSSKDRGRSM